jgi:hypothetical protein
VRTRRQGYLHRRRGSGDADMNPTAAEWKKPLLRVACFLVTWAALFYFLAPSMASGWPSLDRNAVIHIAREFIVSRFLEALLFLVIMSWIFLFGHETRPNKKLQLVPYLALSIFMSAALLIFHRPTVFFIGRNSSGNCLPACHVNDEVCYLTSQICLDAYGVALFVLFKLIPLGLFVLYFAVPIHKAKKLRDAS